MSRVRLQAAALCLIAIAGIAAPSPAAADSRLELEGPFVQGGAIGGRTVPGTEVSLDGMALRVAPDGLFVFGFDRDAPASASLVATFPDGTREQRTFSVSPRDYDIQRIDGLPPEQVTPQTPEQIAKIKRDAETKAAARADIKAGTWFADTFEWPMTGIITGTFGSQRILNGEPRRPHYGVDIAGPVGVEVRAPAGGIVTLAEPDMYFEGGLIFLDHGLGFVSAFMHLSRLDVAVGDRVAPGDVIGAVGATGRVTGPHLDWRIAWEGRQIDPLLLVGPMPETPAEGADRPED